jgi:hypothetical protein
MKCINGHTNPGGANFCNQCGEALATTEPTAVDHSSATSPPLPRGEPKLKRSARSGLSSMFPLTGSHLRLIVGAAAVVVAIAATLFVVQARSQTIDLRGTFTLNDVDSAAANCVGQGGYADIATGTEVTVRDERGTLLATSNLTLASAEESSCTYRFAMAAPRAEFYAIDVGGRRNVLHYSHEQLRLAEWTMAITLGEPTPSSTTGVPVTQPTLSEPATTINKAVLGGTWDLLRQVRKGTLSGHYWRLRAHHR